MDIQRHRNRSLACMLVAIAVAGTACSRSMALAGSPAAPGSRTGQTMTGQAFGSVVPLRKGDSARFADGLVVTVASIDDSRCPANVACVWSGELSAHLALHGGHAGASREVTLGTVTKKNLSVGGYDLALVDAAPDAVKLLVDRPPEKMIGPSR